MNFSAGLFRRCGGWWTAIGVVLTVAGLCWLDARVDRVSHNAAGRYAATPPNPTPAFETPNASARVESARADVHAPATTVLVRADRSAAKRPELSSDNIGIGRLPKDVQLPELVDVQGVRLSVESNKDVSVRVFVFLSIHCPISNSYLPELKRLQQRFDSSGVRMVGVIADGFTSLAEARTHQQSFAVPFPIVLDHGGEVRQQLRPTHTPQAIVLCRDGQVRYSGRIDDRYREIGRPRPEPQRRDLERALNEILAGRHPEVSFTEPIGCLLEGLQTTVAEATTDGPGRVSDLTFCRDIAPILDASCVSCHRPGEAAPFALIEYDDVRRHAEQIRLVVQRGLMPPWKPVPGFGEFHNEQSLSASDRQRIVEWVSAGAPRGRQSDRPQPPRFVDGWQLGEPDLVVEMPEAFEVPADGPDLYQHFVLPTRLREDRLVAAVEFRPGNAEVVHHSFMYLDTSGAARRLDQQDPQPGYSRFGGPGFRPWASLGGWGPGGRPRRLPEGMGRPMPRGSDLVVQIHYHPTGRTLQDRSRVGIYFAPRSATQWVSEIMVADVDLEIPPGEPQYAFEASYTVPVDTWLLDASPHMHLLGREIKVTAVRPDQVEVPLIWIDDWNFYWQDHYVYREPIPLPAGTQIKLQAWYDNSASNPHNPHSPPRLTRFGEGSDDEMGVCYFQVTTRNHSDIVTLTRHAADYYEDMLARHEQAQATRAARLNLQTSRPRPAAN